VNEAGDALFIVNPAAGNGGGAKRWPRIAEAARALGIEPDRVFTDGPGHAVELTANALRDGRRLIVAVGGDGTVNEVVNGFFGDTGEPIAPDAELALAQIGTGRDTIRTYGIDKRPERAIALVARGRTRTVDVGRASFDAYGDAAGMRHFLNVASCGMTGAVAERANRSSKRFGGTPSYVWAIMSTFAGWQNLRVQVEADGEARELVCNNVVCANGRYFGGGLKICPDAEPDDGLFDVLIFGDVSKGDFVRNLPKLYRGTHITHPKATVLRAAHVRVTPGRPLPIELDGEQPGLTPVSFDIVPAALRLRVPD
jgi:diacylglycerol kinase (ATP)